MGFQVVSTRGARVGSLLSGQCYQQTGQPGEVVGRHGQDEAGTYPFDAAIDGLGHSTDGFGCQRRRQIRPRGGAILLFFWLPAEYGIDPARVGRLLGLTEMGEIKQQLYAEAAAEDAALAAAPTTPAAAPTVITDPNVAVRQDTIETQLAAIAAVIGAERIKTEPTTEAAVEAPAVSAEATPAVAPEAQVEPIAPVWRDEVSHTLAPTEGIEVKLVMAEGAAAEFEWTANGGALNFDTHRDGDGNGADYDSGRGVPEQSGTLIAAFTGNRGWFWRNRTSEPVTFTLRTRGEYSDIKLPQ